MGKAGEEKIGMVNIILPEHIQKQQKEHYEQLMAIGKNCLNNTEHENRSRSQSQQFFEECAGEVQQQNTERTDREISQTENLELMVKMFDAFLTIAASLNTVAQITMERSEKTDRQMFWLTNRSKL